MKKMGDEIKMTEREKGEKVIKGLECCTQDHCDPKDCPYYSEMQNCENMLKQHALALLKAQEPRVMTIEELKSCDQETIWFQVKSNHTMKQLTQDGINALIFIGSLHNWNGYGTIWRCWTSRPTDKKKEETPWDVKSMEKEEIGKKFICRKCGLTYYAGPSIYDKNFGFDYWLSNCPRCGYENEINNCYYR